MKSSVSILIIYVISLHSLSPFNTSVHANDLKQDFRHADSIYANHPDSAFTPYLHLYNLSLEANDTIRQIICLERLGRISYQNKNLPEALNFFTEALHLSDQKQETLYKATILAQLGNLYNKYGYLKEGGEYIIESHNIFLKCIKEGKIDNKRLFYSYVSVAQLEIQKENFHAALHNLDTSLLLTETYNNSYRDAVHALRLQATALTALDSLETALKILLPLEKHFDVESVTKSNHSYHYSNAILVNSGIGEIYTKLGKNELALKHLFKSLNLAKRLQKKLDHQVEVLSNIVIVYKNQKKYDLALKYQTEAYRYFRKNLNITSERNKGVLKIRDSYIEKLEEKEKELMAKNLMLANKERANFRLRTIISVFLIFIIAGGFFIWTRIVKSRLKIEQQRIKEKEKVSALELRYKNRELTSNSLQLIERDDLLDKFVKYLDKDKAKEAKSLKFARKQLASNLWEEFEQRFIKIHEGFYERLSDKHPSLTTYDLKLCALIKLNLGSNDISRLLNITEKSVHTARYRIRKKLELKHDASLDDFLSKI